FMAGIAELYAQRGIILKPVDMSDLLLYAAWVHARRGLRMAFTRRNGGAAPGNHGRETVNEYTVPDEIQPR
ncbi:MAG: hypothetical protein ABSD56_07940, partial [Bryobacteraceae bacterium]